MAKHPGKQIIWKVEDKATPAIKTTIELLNVPWFDTLQEPPKCEKCGETLKPPRKEGEPCEKCLPF